jgi:hypothetical protein
MANNLKLSKDPYKISRRKKLEIGMKLGLHAKDIVL